MKKVLLMALSMFLLSSSSQIVVKEETFIGADFSSGIYSFGLMDKFYETPNTFEAWVRLGRLAKNEPGGVIIGNDCRDNYHGTKLEVTQERYISLYWNGGELRATFDEYKLVNDDWAHIAVVRNEKDNSFSLYVNGILKQKINKNVGADNYSDYKYIVGGDWTNWTSPKNVFRGEIAQVSVYSDALTAREVYQDYVNGDEISYKTRDNLMFNGQLSFKCKGITDTSRYANHATLRSNDYLYEGELFEAKDYTFTVVPDPQVMTHWNHKNLATISEFIIDKKDEQKIVTNFCVGDNTDGSKKWDYEFEPIKTVYDEIYKAGVRWITTPGNHDYDDLCSNAGNRNLTWYNKYMVYDEISKFDYFGGAFEVGQSQNTYYLFKESGVNYLVMSLEFGFDNNVLAWANNVVSSYPNHRTIVLTHGYLGGDGERMTIAKPHDPASYGWGSVIQVNNPDQMFDNFIKKHKNMFMVFCGHVPSDDIMVKEDVGENGNVITQFLIDAQGVMYSGAESLLAMLAFDELNQRVSVNMVSTITGKLYNIQNQFSYSFKGYTDILSTNYYDEDGNLKEEYK